MKPLQWICAPALYLLLSPAVMSACKIVQIAEMPVTDRGNRPLLDAQINGQPVAVEVDTGSFATLVWVSAARRLGLPLHDTNGLTAFGAGGEVRMLGTMIKDLRIGSFSATDLRLGVLDKGEMEGAPGSPVMLLGEDFFSHFTTEFDFAHNMIRLLQPQGCELDQLVYWARTYSMAELSPESRQAPRIHTQVLVNGKQVDAILDTGATVSWIENASALRVGMTAADAPGSGPTVSHGVGSAAPESHLGRFDSLSIGDETTRNAQLRVSDLFSADTMPATGSHVERRVGGLPEMLLGYDFFRAHRMLVLWKEHKLLFTYNGGPIFQVRAPQGEP